MPCFKGLAVSIHTPDGPLAEHSIQKHSRAGRITSYIAVPPPIVPKGSTTGKAEQSAFAVSVTLLVPGQDVPYSAPKPTPENPYPQGRKVGPSPGGAPQPNGPSYTPLTIPYIPRTHSDNETLAAYIYFDGRPKEEVATLLRRGEETWVNSRWVSLPGGGLAERDFLFREVGLERFLNGLDLDIKPGTKSEPDVTHKKKLVNRKNKNKVKSEDDSESDAERKPMPRPSRMSRDEVLRYGEDSLTPIDAVSADRSILDSDTSSDDDEESERQAAGQIKIALFRVLASGDVKKGEYEAKFDAQEEVPGDDGAPDDLDHTTSLADPKALDPKSISTQTVTGLDGPDHPYAIFTFLYRGEKQLRKMGVIQSPDPQANTSSKRKSSDFSNLDPLTKYGTVGFSGYREVKKGPKDPEDMDSDNDDDDNMVADKDDDALGGSTQTAMTPEELRKQRELAEGVRQIKLKRAHSSEAMPSTNKSPRMKQLENAPPVNQTQLFENPVTNDAIKPTLAAPPSDAVADGTSPFKKQRADVTEGSDTASDKVALVDSTMDVASGSKESQSVNDGTQNKDTNIDEEL